MQNWHNNWIKCSNVGPSIWFNVRSNRDFNWVVSNWMGDSPFLFDNKTHRVRRETENSSSTIPWLI